MTRTFIETTIFKQLIDHQQDQELERMIKNSILQDPKCGDVISGTGGIRKFRINDKKRGKGKRGGLRVLYLDLPLYEVTYLLLIYGKDQYENISAIQKKVLRVLVEGIKDEYKKKKRN